MKAKDLRELTEEELKEKERESSQELFNLRFQKATLTGRGRNLLISLTPGSTYPLRSL